MISSQQFEDKTVLEMNNDHQNEEQTDENIPDGEI